MQPATADQVADILRWASQEKVAIVPRGAGTGVMGGAIPLRPAVVLDLTRLDDVAVHAEDMCIEAGAGATLAALARAAEEHGLMFAHDPWSVSMATVGGAIATNGMGYLFGPYGKMGDQVLAVEAALPDGTVLRTRPTLSGGPGPMLHKLFAGAEGVLGVVTRAWLRGVAGSGEPAVRGLPLSHVCRRFRRREGSVSAGHRAVGHGHVGFSAGA